MKYNSAEQVRQQSMDEYGFGPRAMKKLKVCKACGYASPSERSFCTECGEKLPEKTLFQEYAGRHKYCKTCDTVVREDTEYCPQCGEKLN